MHNLYSEWYAQQCKRYTPIYHMSGFGYKWILSNIWMLKFYSNSSQQISSAFGCQKHILFTNIRRLDDFMTLWKHRRDFVIILCAGLLVLSNDVPRHVVWFKLKVTTTSFKSIDIPFNWCRSWRLMLFRYIWLIGISRYPNHRQTLIIAMRSQWPMVDLSISILPQ